MQRRLTDAERRVAHTETVVLDLEAQLLGERRERAARGYSATRTMSRSRSRSPPHTSRTPPSIEPQVGPLRFTSMLLYRLDESMLTLASTRLYPDPVARGVVSAAHVELAWHGFKARIAALLPLPPFLAVSTPVPAHGFVVAAALTHVQSAYTPDLEPLLDECILLAMGSAVSIDVMLALLIFSLAPLPPDHEDGRAGLDPPREHSTAAAGTRRRHRLTARGPYRLISLAFQMGQSFGFEAMAESALKRGQELNDEWNGEQLWHLQLWAAIVNRFCLLALINGQIMSLPARVADRLPLLQRDAVEMCNRHLRAEASAIAIFEPVARKLSALEHTNNYDLESLREFQTVWSRAKEQSNALLQGDTQPREF
jgi:hypothetical protein